MVLHDLASSKTADEICRDIQLCTNSTCQLGPLAGDRLHMQKGASLRDNSVEVRVQCCCGGAKWEGRKLALSR